MMKTRKDSFFGIHCDFHAKPEDEAVIGRNLREEDIREICRLLRPDFWQIDCKGHPGYTSYPSKLGNAIPHFAFDPLALWRRVTREEDVALYMHYSGVYEIKYCREHPDQNVRMADGTYAEGATRTDGTYVDDLMIPQLTELAERYEVDGVWVDGDCWKAQADFRPESLAAFEKETGIDLGGHIPATPADPYYHEYRDYHRELFRRYLRHYADTLHARFPELQICSNWAFSDHMPEPVCANVDFLSGDLNPKNSFHSARYAARALAGQGKPWDLMAWGFRQAIGANSAYCPKHITQILQEAAAVISLGGAFQCYVAQHPDGSLHMPELCALSPLADFMRAREAFCFRGTPRCDTALLLSTYDRSRESKRLWSRNGYEKIMGLCALLCDAGQTLDIVSEHMLAADTVGKYKMLTVPELYEGLDSSTIDLLLDYAKHGGHLLLAGRNTCRIFSEAGAPFCVDSLILDRPSVAGFTDNGHTEGKVASDLACIFTVGGYPCGAVFSPCIIRADGAKAYATVSPSLYESTNDPLAVTLPYGEGTISAIGFDIGSQYLSGTQYLHRTLISRMANELYTPTVRIESATGLLELVPLEKDGRLYIQLINAGGNHANQDMISDDVLPPVCDICLSLSTKEKPTALVLQPEGRTLPFTWRDGRAYVELPRLDIHAIIEIIP